MTISRLNVEALESALARLGDGFADAEKYPEVLTVRDGVIQRFEIAMDMAWKLMARALKDIYDVDQTEILTKKDIFRFAAKYRLLDDAEAWFGHYAARNNTSHRYDSLEADRTFERAKAFLPDALISLERLRHAA